MSEKRRFPNTPSSVTQARRFVQEHLAGTPQAVADTVAVMTSELATNSIRHAESEFEVNVDRSNREIRVEVTDEGSGTPTVLSPDPTQPSGRGLFIVDKLADDWGVTSARDCSTKTVWFRVALPATN
jgi:serine/threonine-protein kinase RsbW